MLSAAEQLLLEMINRARLDPESEADLYGIDLNEGLSAGRLGPEARQVLAPNRELGVAAHDHSEWLMDADDFSHTGENGSSHSQRMRDAGYELEGSWRTGENLALWRTTGTVNEDWVVTTHHAGLFDSPGHRLNILNGDFREIGIGQYIGEWTTDGRDWNTSIVTEKFAKSGTDLFLTGVVYSDTDEDEFYDVGEGRGGAIISTAQQGSTTTWAAGGYSHAVSGSSNTIEMALDGQVQVRVTLGGQNAKVDLVDGTRVESSADLEILQGATEAKLLGVADLDLTGSGARELLLGNDGDNLIDAGEGNDTINAGDGADTIEGGGGADRIKGQGNADQISGWQGNDRIWGGKWDDELKGNQGNDRLWGQNGADTLEGGWGGDRLFGGNQGDLLSGGGNDDELNGDAGADELFGDGGDDTLNGGDGNDFLSGGDGTDLLDGGAGRDTLDGGRGNDTMTGGSGPDQFVFDGAIGRDRITDFSDDDMILMTGQSGEATTYTAFMNSVTQVGDNAVYDHGNDSLHKITFEGINRADLSEGQFDFM
ncbi:MAG: CAP domain-containing protein [Pseudomonadota bacterium]